MECCSSKVINYYNSNKFQIIFVFAMLAAGVIAAIVYGEVKTRVNELQSDHFDVKIHDDKVFPSVDLNSFDSKLNLSNEVRQGKALLVYMHTGCSGCKVEAGILAKSNVREKLGVKIYLTGFESFEKWEEFTNEHELNFPVFYDKDHALRKALGVDFFPANFLINDGKIERSWKGTPKDATVLYRNLGFDEK